MGVNGGPEAGFQPDRSDRVRFACMDTTRQPIEPKDPATAFGGIGEFVLTRQRPPFGVLG